MRFAWLATGALVISVTGTAWSDRDRLAVADVPTPPAPSVAAPTPQRSPGAPPLLPPEGLPTAPPPDAIKPVEPRAVQPQPDPASASGRAPVVRTLRGVSGGV